MRIVKDGYPFIGILALVTVGVGYMWGAKWAVIPFLLTCFVTYFFRNPDRPLPADDNIYYSPADGTVMSVEEFDDEEYLNCKAIKVIIFLSVFNVHVNRCPISGEIKYQRYTCGEFVPAYKNSATFKNERLAMGIDNGKNKLLVIQVAGLLARRIVSWVNLGRNVRQGECYGMIKFGSSTELVMPVDTEICVKKGDSVVGGITVIGRRKQ